MNGLELKNSVLSENSIFSTLNAAEIARIAGQVELVNFAAGETVFTIGDEATNMYIVVSGDISVIKSDDYGNSREIAKIIKGDNLGEMDMISGIPRNVTALADTPLVLLRFPAPPLTFPRFLSDNPGPGSKILYAFIGDIAERTRAANDVLKENSPHIQELRHQIYEDKLTRLYNKTFLEENLPLKLGANAQPVTLMMIKPDNFKQVNDQAGHDAGDKLLVHLAALLPGILPPDSLLVRYLGNEFALVLSGCGPKGARALAKTIRQFYNALDVSRYFPVDDFQLTVSIGIAVFPAHAGNAADLIEQAHQLPLIGRERGGNLILTPEDLAERKI